MGKAGSMTQSVQEHTDLLSGLLLLQDKISQFSRMHFKKDNMIYRFKVKKVPCNCQVFKAAFNAYCLFIHTSRVSFICSRIGILMNIHSLFGSVLVSTKHYQKKQLVTNFVLLLFAARQVVHSGFIRSFHWKQLPEDQQTKTLNWHRLESSEEL